MPKTAQGRGITDEAGDAFENAKVAPENSRMVAQGALETLDAMTDRDEITRQRRSMRWLQLPSADSTFRALR